MHKRPVFTRPTFDEAIKAWQTLLRERALPADCLWLFEENLCFEKAQYDEGVRLAYQTQFAPPPPGAELITYRYFTQFEWPVVFYRIGSARGKSLCLLLCDAWFAGKGQEQGYISRDEWLVSFYPGQATEVEEITDQTRWKNRLLRNRPVQPLDFCMTLKAVHETLAHGRVLSPYEHYALKFLHAWRQFLPHKHKNKLDN
jgi:hypothetical protein